MRVETSFIYATNVDGGGTPIDTCHVYSWGGIPIEKRYQCKWGWNTY